MDLSSVVILKEYSRKLWRSITRPMSWVTSFNELNTEKITKKKKNFITYATRKVYANMINLQGIRTRSFAPFESKGIFTKKKRKNTIYPKVKLLTKTFTLARMKNIFENFLLITQRVKKKRNYNRIDSIWTNTIREEYFWKFWKISSKEIHTFDIIHFQAITIKGNNWNDIPDRRSTVIDVRRLSVGTDQTACSLPRPINEAFSLSWNGYSC